MFKYYDNIKIKNKTIKQIFNSDAFKRLDGIKQNGYTGIRLNIDYSRKTHSIHVAFLTAYFGGTTEDIIHALLHDIFHTNFSHVVDYLGENPSESFHEKNKANFIESKIMFPIKGYLQEFIDLKKTYIKDIYEFFDESKFPIVKDNKTLATDILSYTIDDALYFDSEKKENIIDNLNHIHSFKKDNKTYLFSDNSNVSMFFINLSFKINFERYCSAWNHAENYLFASDLKKAIDDRKITFDELVYGNKSDLEILEKINISDKLKYFNKEIYKFKSEIKNIFNFDLLIDIKENRIRLMNPLIKINNDYKFISDYSEGTEEFNFNEALKIEVKKILLNTKIYVRKN